MLIDSRLIAAASDPQSSLQVQCPPSLLLKLLDTSRQHQKNLRQLLPLGLRGACSC
jgi:hypothetical protein